MIRNLLGGMLGDVSYRPFNGEEKANNPALFLEFPCPAEIKPSYNLPDITRRYVSYGMGSLAELLEELNIDHGDEIRTGETNWEATDRDITDGMKPYDGAEEEETKEETQEAEFYE